MIGHSSRFEMLVLDISLWRAMVTVLGSIAFNEDKKFQCHASARLPGRKIT
jgi:hypothetical protein